MVLCNKNLMKILQKSGRIPNLDDELEKLQQQKQKYVSLDELNKNEVITSCDVTCVQFDWLQ